VGAAEPWVDAMRAGHLDVDAEGLPPRARKVLQGLLAAASGAPCDAVEHLRAGAPEGRERPASLESVLARQDELCRATSSAGRADEPARTEPRADARPVRPRRDGERPAAAVTASPVAPSPAVTTGEEPGAILDDARRALLVGEFSRAIAQAKRVASQPALSGEAHKVMAVANARLGRYCTAKGHYLVYLESAPPALRAPVRQMLQEEEFKACP
jgi:hypothetical protein